MLAPTGGVNEKNIAEYINFGAHCCGISSAIPTKFDVIDDEAKQIITEKAKLLTTIANKAREVN